MKRFCLLILFFSISLSPSAFAQEESEWDAFWKWIKIEIYKDQENYSNYSTPDYQDLVLKIDLKTKWKFNISDNMEWVKPNYNDDHWVRINVPAKWENEGFNGYDGMAWYRIHFDGRKLSAKQAHILILGQIDDVDECYLNGKKIGQSGRFEPSFKTAYNATRQYLIPNEAINFSGDNVIAVRVYDQVLDGGIVGGEIGIYATLNSENLKQDLAGPWKFRRGDHKGIQVSDFDDSDWDEIWVPSAWDDQGYRTYDGVAWYRKNFELSFTPDPNTQYYLLMGRIDDFDITYLNGVRVGMTNDGKGFGASTSYGELRTYLIPKGLLKAGKKNTIAVSVTDIGFHGGIIKGPVGIAEKSQIGQIE